LSTVVCKKVHFFVWNPDSQDLKIFPIVNINEFFHPSHNFYILNLKIKPILTEKIHMKTIPSKITLMAGIVLALAFTFLAHRAVADRQALFTAHL